MRNCLEGESGSSGPPTDEDEFMQGELCIDEDMSDDNSPPDTFNRSTNFNNPRNFNAHNNSNNTLETRRQGGRQSKMDILLQVGTALDQKVNEYSAHSPLDCSTMDSYDQMEVDENQQQDAPLDLSLTKRPPCPPLLRIRSDLMAPSPALQEGALDLSSPSSHQLDLSSSPRYQPSRRSVYLTPTDSDPRHNQRLAAQSRRDFINSPAAETPSSAHCDLVKKIALKRSISDKNHEVNIDNKLIKVRQSGGGRKADTAATRADTAASSPPPPSGIWNLTIAEVEGMLSPYIVTEEKKQVCNLCNIKFNSRDKALSHVENKHVDCFQYKCPGCRTTKTSRLAFDCHTRSRHAAARNTMLPLLRLKRQFSVKNSATAAASSPEKKENKGYDLHFVTFLRDELNSESGLSAMEALNLMDSVHKGRGSRPPAQTNMPDKCTQNKPCYLRVVGVRCRCSSSFYKSSNSVSSSPTSSPSPTPSREGSLSPSPQDDLVVPLASWINKNQGIFLIYEKDKFARKWFSKKGESEGDWSRLQTEVLSIFESRNLIKVISNAPMILQVYCIRQLLK